MNKYNELTKDNILDFIKEQSIYFPSGCFDNTQEDNYITIPKDMLRRLRKEHE